MHAYVAVHITSLDTYVYIYICTCKRTQAQSERVRTRPASRDIEYVCGKRYALHEDNRVA